jgi:hypothetical protein
VPRSSRTGQRAFDEAASLCSPTLDEGEAALSGTASNEPMQVKRLLAIVCAKSLYLSSSRKTAIMAEINKLSAEKALDKLRASDAKQSKDTLLNNKIDALDEEIERTRTQRLRHERHQRSVISRIIEMSIRYALEASARSLKPGRIAVERGRF